MRFCIDTRYKILKSCLLYRTDEHSFDVEGYETGYASLLINDLQLEIDDEGRVLFVWGLCPLVNCKKTKGLPKNYQSHCLFVLLDDPIVPGVGYQLNSDERWPVYINQNHGWICIGRPDTFNITMVEFASNCVASIEEDKLVAIWLSPKYISQLKATDQ